ncbi:MAG: hypothetical protein U1E23_01475 [Reyranellaceae bacterium]
MTAPTAADPPPPTPNDQALLAALANGGRVGRPLTPDDERLLDGLVDGRLAGDVAAQALALVRDNALAAERVLERRLVDAARQGPPAPRVRLLWAVPAAWSPADVLPAALRRPLSLRWSLGGALAVAVAAAIVVAVAPLLRPLWVDQAGPQVAVVVVADRTPLLEPSDSRRRGAAPAPPAAGASRFVEAELPGDLLRALLAAGGGVAQEAAVRRLEAAVPRFAQGAGPRPVLYVDSALAARLAASPTGTVIVRLYDLADPRLAELRQLVDAPAGQAAWLLTGQP